MDSIKHGSEIVGSRVRAKVVKNKVAPPFRVGEFDIMFDRGISKEGELVDLGVEMGIIKKSGVFFSFGETRIGQGRENAKEYLRQHEELARQIERQIRSGTNIPLPSVVAESEAVDS